MVCLDIDVSIYSFLMVYLVMAIAAEELVWVLRARVRDFITGMQGADGALTGVGKSTEALGGKSKRLGVAWRGLSSVGNVFVAVLAGIGAILASIGNSMAGVSSRTHRMLEGFHNLARTAGADGNRILRAMNDALDGTVSKIDLITEANRALVSGLPASAEKMGELTRVARGMAKIMGIDVTEALQRMVRGIAKQEIELLDELFGGSIKFIDVLRELGPQATATEKQLAIYNAVVAAGKERVDRANLSLEGYDTTMERVSAKIVNLKLLIGDALIPVFETLAEKIGDAAEKLEELITDRTVNRLRELGQDDLADAAQAQLTLPDLEARRGRLRVQAQRERLATRRSEFAGGRLEGVDIAAVQRALTEVTGQEVAAINARVAAEQKLAEVKKRGGVFEAAGTLEAEKALGVAREKEQVLSDEHERLKALHDTLKQIAGLDAEILKTRQKAAEIGHALPEITATAKRDTPPTAIENILATTAPLIESDRRQRSHLGVRRDVLHQKVEIATDVGGDKLERDLKDAAGRAARKSQDAMVRFTDEVPARFEENMRDTFDAVQNLANSFGLRTHGILSGAFSVVSGRARLSQTLSGTSALAGIAPTLGKVSKTLANVASVLGPVGGVIGGAVGIFKGVQSLFGSRDSGAYNPTAGRTPGAITRDVLTEEQLRARIAEIDAWLANFQRLVDEGMAIIPDRSEGGEYWRQTDIREQLQQQLDRILSGEDDPGGGQGREIYTTTITVTDVTAKNLIAAMTANNTNLATNNTRLNALKTAVVNLNTKIQAWSPTLSVSGLTPEEIAALQGLLKAETLTPEQVAALQGLLQATTLTPEQIAALTPLLQATTLTPEQREALAALLKGETLTPEQIAALTPLLQATTLTPEQREALAALLKGETLTPEQIAALTPLLQATTLTDAQINTLKDALKMQTLTTIEREALETLLRINASLSEEQKNAIRKLLAVNTDLTPEQTAALKKLLTMQPLSEDEKREIERLLASEYLSAGDRSLLERLLNGETPAIEIEEPPAVRLLPPRDEELQEMTRVMFAQLFDTSRPWERVYYIPPEDMRDDDGGLTSDADAKGIAVL